MDPLALAAVGLTSAALLMTELALTRIFSVVMYYHFAFLAISIALFGLSASGVFAYLRRTALDRQPVDRLLATRAVAHAVCTIVALFLLVRLRVGLNYSAQNLAVMLAIYTVAALPFFSGGLVITLAISRLSSRINAVYAADLLGAAAGCLVLIPLLNRVGAPGVLLSAAALAALAAVLFAAPSGRLRFAAMGAGVLAVPLAAHLAGVATFDMTVTKGHQGDRVLFSKWNSFSRIGVYERTHGDWSLSYAYKGPLPDTRFMDIDSAASTPILHVSPDLSNAQYLHYELTALVYHLKERKGLGISGSGLGSRESGSGIRELGPIPNPQSLVPADPGPIPNPQSLVPADPGPIPADSGFNALVIGPGGGRDLVSALVFGAHRGDAVEINPIIANDVMRGQFAEFSGRIYSHPRVHVFVDDGRSFVKRTADRYDVIQASLVDTWAATAAGAYTLTENTLYTVEAFNDYLDHLTEDGVLSITRWIFDGLRLVSLAQEACAARGWDPSTRIAIVRQNNVATFLLKRSPFTPAELAELERAAGELRFEILYAPTPAGRDLTDLDAREATIDGTPTGDYRRLILAKNRQRFYDDYQLDIRPTTDDRPFFFLTTRLEDQFQLAFSRAMLFGNGVSALLTLFGISATLVTLFVVGPLVLAGGARPRGWWSWLVYFGALGAGFMLIEVAVLQRFVLLLGHPVYSLTVTLFSLLLGTGLGAALSRRLDYPGLPRSAALSIVVIAVLAIAAIVVVTPLVDWAIPFSRGARIAVAAATLVPIGMALGIPMPAGIRLLSARAPQMVTWAWGMNGAFSVIGATLALFIAMNWGFRVTLLVAAFTYLLGLSALITATRTRPT